MRGKKQSTVVGVFEDHQQAGLAVNDLRGAGFRDDQIAVARQTSGREDDPTSKEKPGQEPGVLGAMADFFKGLFGSEEETNHYKHEYWAGRTIVRVKANGRDDEALVILQRHGGYNKETPRETTVAPATAQTTTAASGTACSTEGGKVEEGQTIQLHEEKLHARKRPVQTGEVQVRKEVVTETKMLEVPVQREEIVIERHPVAGRAASSSDIRSGEEIRIPVKEEQVHVSKEAVVKEEVTVGKRKVSETKRVGGTVRKEQARVESKGKVDVCDTGAGKKSPRK